MSFAKRVRLRRDSVLLLHPFLFAATSVLIPFAGNLREASFSDIVPALGGAWLFALVLYLAFGLMVRRLDARAAVLATLWVFICLFYADLFRPLNRVLGGDFPMVPTLPVALAVLALLTVLIARTRLSLRVPHLVLAGVAVVIFVAPAWRVASYEWRNGAARAVYDPAVAEATIAGVTGAASAASAAGGRYPDIYYFIFDRFASHDILVKHYGVDNSDLMHFLEQKGFYIANMSRSNYLKTGHSLASTFYMDYLDFLSEDERIAPSNWHPIHEMLDDHRVARFLKARGYQFLQFGSWWGGTFHSSAADENHPQGFSEFNMIYLWRTMARPLVHILPESRLTRSLYWDNGQCQRVKSQIEHIKSLGDRERPVFVFAHILVPHGPEVFSREGRCLSRRESLERGRRQGYIDQVAYAGTLIESLVTSLLDEGREAPIIIIQADEGPFPERYYEHAPSWREAMDFEIEIKTSIINTYYFPDGNYGALYPDITPVNSFRILFNKYFGTKFAQLPDQIYGFPGDFNLYEFFDVTEIARGGGSKPDPVREPTVGEASTEEYVVP